MTTTDPRGACWINAHDCLEIAQKLIRDPKFSWENPIQEKHYWAIMAEATLFARLASVDAQVGFTVGAVLVGRGQEKIEVHQRAEKFLADKGEKE